MDVPRIVAASVCSGGAPAGVQRVTAVPVESLATRATLMIPALALKATTALGTPFP
jgi:hypothetical protein